MTILNLTIFDNLGYHWWAYAVFNLYVGKHVEPLAPAAFVVVSTHQPTLGPRIRNIHKEGLCPSIRDINRLMMMKRFLKQPLDIYVGVSPNILRNIHN
jgi:hypothetical protein